jgi:hypothetical protein
MSRNDRRAPAERIGVPTFHRELLGHRSSAHPTTDRAREYAKLARRSATAGGIAMDAAETVAREAIRDVIARYNHAGDRGRLDALLACFSPDGEMDLEGVPLLRGREAIRGHLEGVVRDLAKSTARATLRHHVSSLLIELTGADTANAFSYFVTYTEIGLDHWGRYQDRLVRQGGAWLLSHRRVRVDGASKGSRMAVAHRVKA